MIQSLNHLNLFKIHLKKKSKEREKLKVVNYVLSIFDSLKKYESEEVLKYIVKIKEELGELMRRGAVR